MARRGLSLGSKLLLASLLLLTLPWLAWRAMVAFEAFLVDGQLRALELLASSATLLLQPQAGHLAGRVGAGSILLYAWPLDADESFDGYPGRWPEITGDGLAIGRATPGAPAGRLRLGTRDGRLYGLVAVNDPRPDYRNPGNPELATSDQLRLELHGDDGVSRYRVLAAQGPGRVDILPSTPDGERQVIGPDLGIEAVWQPGRDGYTVEFRLPLALLEQHPVLRIAVHDGDSGRDAISPPLRPRYREPALEALLGGLDAGTARVWVVDRDRWVRASVGGPSGLGEPPHGWRSSRCHHSTRRWRGIPGVRASPPVTTCWSPLHRFPQPVASSARWWPNRASMTCCVRATARSPISASPAWS